MITSKERKALSAMGQRIEPSFQIGKNCIGDNTVEEISKQLEARELIKIAVLKNSDCEPREVSDELCSLLNADGVSCVGSKIVIYRKSSKKDFKHIEF